MNFRDDAFVDARPPALTPAADKAGKLFDILRARRPQHRDPAVPQICLIVEGTRVAIIARRMKFSSNQEPRAVGSAVPKDQIDARILSVRTLSAWILSAWILGGAALQRCEKLLVRIGFKPLRSVLPTL